MNYLVISNKGLIQKEDLMLIGSSTKRDQSGKIGMFGSGWKYAIAWLLRNDCQPRIFSGVDEIMIDTEIVLHRDNPVQVITVNGEKTSLTTEMGCKWKGWMALREVVSNAIDEGEHSTHTVWNPLEMKGQEGKSVVWIPMNGELAEVMANFNHYFAFERVASFENSRGRLFLKSEKSKLSIYRKGIRCYDTSRLTSVDFDLDEIDINEDRLCSEGGMDSAVRRLISEGIPSGILKTLLNDQYYDWFPQEPNKVLMESLRELHTTGEVFTCPALKDLGGMILSRGSTITVPNKWYKVLQDEGLAESVFEKISGDVNFIRTDAKDVRKIEYYLRNMNLSHISVQSGKFSSPYRECAVKGNTFMVKDTISDDVNLTCQFLRDSDNTTLLKIFE